MNEIFQFIPLLIASHLILGCTLAALVQLIVSRLSLNAMTRHNIWLGLLFVLILMPLASLLPSSTTESVSHPFFSGPVTGATLQDINAALGIELDPVGEVTGEGPASAANASAAFSDSAPAGPQHIDEVLSIWVMDKLPLFQFGVALVVFIGIGSAIKLLLFIRSYQNLKQLFDLSVDVSSDWSLVADGLSRRIGLRDPPLLKQNPGVNTPATSGILNPWIVLPAAFVNGGGTAEDLRAVLLHELAHVKRHDPLIATLQTAILILFFWHPAFYYINRQVRRERELACDDMAMEFTDTDPNTHAKAYAGTLLKIAKSLNGTLSSPHSVACVQSSRELVDRITFLLDRRANHSTTVQPLHSFGVTLVTAVFLLATLQLWPSAPRAYAEILKETDPVTATQGMSEGFLIRRANEQTDIAAIAEVPKGQPVANGPAASEIPPLVDIDYERIAALAPVDVPDVGETVRSSVIARVANMRNELARRPKHGEYISGALQELPNLSVASEQYEFDVKEKFPTRNLTVFETKEPDVEDHLGNLDNISRSKMITEVKKIEREYYRVFNASIEDKDLKFYCGRHRPTGSYFSTQLCEPRFMVKARSASTRGLTFVFSQSLPPRVEELAQAMNTLLAESAYFRELHTKLQMLKARLEEVG